VKRYLAALSLVVACTNERPLPPTSSADESTPQDGGTLVRRLGGDVVTLNPVLANSLWDRYIDFYLFTPMVNFDSNLQVIPGLADKWEISDDGKLYTFHLNQGATFSDGAPVRASDVLFTLRKIVDPQTEAPQIAGGFEQVDRKTTRVIDEHTIVIGFKQELAAELTKFNDLLVLPEHVYGKGDFKTDFLTRAVGSGPYRVREWRHADRIVFEANRAYFLGAPAITHIEMRFIPDTNTLLNLVRAHEIDVTGDITVNQLQELRKMPGVTTKLVPTNSFMSASTR